MKMMTDDYVVELSGMSRGSMVYSIEALTGNPVQTPQLRLILNSRGI